MNGQVITKEMDEVYRKVRRFYAEQDVRRWLKDHEVEVGEDVVFDLTEAYDEWQGDNPHWYEAIGEFAANMGLEW